MTDAQSADLTRRVTELESMISNEAHARQLETIRAESRHAELLSAVAATAAKGEASITAVGVRVSTLEDSAKEGKKTMDMIFKVIIAGVIGIIVKFAMGGGFFNVS